MDAEVKVEDMDDYYDQAELVDVVGVKQPEGASSDKNSKSHVCDTCLKTFRTAKELKIHTRVHTNERPYKCSECDKAFKQHGALADHLNTHTGAKKHVCKVCGGKFSTNSSLKRHIKKIHEKMKTLACSLCNKTFLNKAACAAHKDTHFTDILQMTADEIWTRGEVEGFRCTICDKTFKRKSKLTEHLDVHSEKLHTCPHCKRSFSHLAFKRHLQNRHPIQECGLCDQKFYRRRLFLSHEKKHFTVTSDVCDYCGGIFATSQQLREHMPLVHCETGEQTLCFLCVKSYRSADHLQQHLEYAHVKCNLCKKFFADYDKMQTHFSNKHKAFKCTRCKLIFRSKPHLAFHLNTAHLIITKFSCGICGVRFSRYKHLHSHQIAHAMMGHGGTASLISDLPLTQDDDSKNTDALLQIPEFPLAHDGNNSRSADTSEQIQPNVNEDSHLQEERKTSRVKKKRMKETTDVKKVGKNHEHTKKSRGKKRHSVSQDARPSKTNKTEEHNDRSRETTKLDKVNSEVAWGIDLSKSMARCQFCSAFVCRKYLPKHCARLHGKHVCLMCLGVFFAHTQLEAHQCQATVDGINSCKFCVASFPNRSELRHHIRSDHMTIVGSRLRYKCQYCEARLGVKDSLLRHQYTHHLSQLPKVVRDKYAGQLVACTMCGKLVHLSGLRQHVKMHGRETLQVKSESMEPTVKLESEEAEEAQGVS